MGGKGAAVFDPSTNRKSNNALQGMVCFKVIPITGGVEIDPLNIREDGGCDMDPNSEFVSGQVNPQAAAFGCPQGFDD